MNTDEKRWTWLAQDECWRKGGPTLEHCLTLKQIFKSHKKGYEENGHTPPNIKLCQFLYLIEDKIYKTFSYKEAQRILKIEQL